MKAKSTKKFQTYTIDGHMICPYCGEIEKVTEEHSELIISGECLNCKSRWLLVIGQSNEVHWIHLER
jgi:hypothetical protein